MQRAFHWGIIGPGKIAGKFAEDLVRVRDGMLYAAASRSLDRARAFVAEHRGVRAYGSYAELAADPKVDAVYIATPHPGHAENAIRCLEAGKAVLCEKPLAMNSEEVARMVAAARRSGSFLMEAIWTRVLPGTLQLLDWIAAGRLGRVQSVTADFGFRAPYAPEKRLYNKALGGGALLDIGIYPVFLANLLLGEPTDITGYARLSETGVDLEDNLVLRYADDRHARVHASLAHATPCEAWVYGSEGKAHLAGRWHETKAITLYPNDGEPERVDVSAAFKGGRGYNVEIEHVQRCLQQGLSESPLLPLEFSVELMRTLDRIRDVIGLRYSTQ